MLLKQVVISVAALSYYPEAVFLRSGNVPSQYVPVLMPPTVSTDSINVSPEELVRASLPWDGMEMRADDAARWHLDRYNEHGTAGKNLEIPIALPPTYHGSNDLDKQRDAQLNLDNWINVVETPNLPDTAGPTLYTTHQKPAGYYRNPYTVPKISFVELSSTTAAQQSHYKQFKDATSEKVLAQQDEGHEDARRSPAHHQDSRVLYSGPPREFVAESLMRQYPSPDSRADQSMTHSGTSTFGGYDSNGYPSTVPGVPSAPVNPGHSIPAMFIDESSGAGKSFGEETQQSNDNGHAGYRTQAPFLFDMMPYLKMRSKLQQFAPNDESEEAKVGKCNGCIVLIGTVASNRCCFACACQALDLMNVMPTPTRDSLMKLPQFASRNYFFPTSSSDLDSDHKQYKSG